MKNTSENRWRLMADMIIAQCGTRIGHHTFTADLNLNEPSAAVWCDVALTPAFYFAALDFFLAAHRALAASDRRLRRAIDIVLFLAGADFFRAADLAAVAVWTAIVSGEPSRSASRIFVRRSISLFNSVTAPLMLILPPLN